jgi:hypothetical protein
LLLRPFEHRAGAPALSWCDYFLARHIAIC